MLKNQKQKNLIIVNPIVNEEEKLQELLKIFLNMQVLLLFISLMIVLLQNNDQRKNMLSELAFSGRHAEQSMWVLTQSYKCVLKDLRRQTKWLCVFFI